jgi:hypothetical protein
LLFGVLIDVENKGVIYFHSVDVQLAQGIERILRGAKVIKINVTSEFSQRINRVAHGQCRVLNHNIFRHFN